MSETHRFKDHHREGRVFFRRLMIAGILVVGLFGVLLARYYSLQVTHHQNYVTQSERNRVHVQPVPPTRGLIYDRHGELLAGNRASYILSIIPERIGNLDQTLELLRPLVEINPTDLEKFYDQLQQPRKPFAGVPLRYQLSEEEIARLAVNEFRLEGVEVEAQLVRHYPYAELFAHTLGYTGRISQANLAHFDEEDTRRYSGTHSIGKNGLELEYEDELLGEVGNQNVETNARGRVLRVLSRVDPKPGKDLVLNLDADLQRVATQALADRRGAAVALDVKTGAVLAAVSMPSFDPNLFVTGISFRDYRNLNQSLDLPLFNRFLQGQYPPGSTLKPVMGAGGLHHEIITPSHTVRDPGFYRLPNSSHQYRDWKRQGHAPRVDLMQAIVESCDTYFYDLGHRMGIDLMHDFGRHFGLGQPTGVDLPSERKGLWPSRAWKRGARGVAWYPGDNLNVVIGQGDVLATPMQLAVVSATLANRGQRLRPQMVKILGDEPQAPIVDGQIELDDRHWDFIHEAMANVMHGERGTARRVGQGAPYRMAGKSGTAQVVAIAQGEEYDSEALLERQRDHALFIAFAPLEDPRIAVAVIVENAESGSGVAAPVARAIMDAHLLGPGSVAEVSQ